jgi:hypothetical protein
VTVRDNLTSPDTVSTRVYSFIVQNRCATP